MNNVEQALKDAMTARVAGVQAPPTMAQSVRRRNRRHVVRFRTVGVAVLTAAVAGAVPVVLKGGTTASQVGAQPTAAPTGETTAIPGIAVPELVGMDLKQAIRIVQAAGLDYKIVQRVSDQKVDGKVVAMRPAAGSVVPEKSDVELVVLSNPEAEKSASIAPMPQDLGDLGDGRTFGGIHLGYLPDGLTWGKWSGKNGFGITSYTTTFVVAGLDPGMYSVQVVVYEGDAAKNARKGGERVAKGTYLASYDEGGQVSSDSSATRTITRVVKPGLAVEIMVSPDYVKQLGGAADEELKKIAAGVEVS